MGMLTLDPMPTVEAEALLLESLQAVAHAKSTGITHLGIALDYENSMKLDKAAKVDRSQPTYVNIDTAE